MRTRFAAAVLGVALTWACAGPSADPVIRGESAAQPPTFAELSGATYAGIWEGGAVTLSAGRWQGPPFVEGGASVPAVWLGEQLYLTGDLDGDEVDEAVVHLTYGSGGTGDFGYLAVMGRANGEPAQEAIGEVGDRVQIRDARIESGRLVLDVLQAGPQDGMCCPSQLARRTFAVEDGRLVEKGTEVTGTASLATLEGKEWVLRKLSAEEDAPAEPEITLVFEAGRISGSSGCNRYSGSVGPGQSATDLVVGPLAMTRRACAPEVMSLEQRYTVALQNARRWGFQFGRLWIHYGEGEVFGSLAFEARKPSE